MKDVYTTYNYIRLLKEANYKAITKIIAVAINELKNKNSSLK